MSCVGGGRELIHRCHIDNTGVVTVVRGVAAVVVESHTGPHLNSPLSIRFSLAWSRLRLVVVPLTRVQTGLSRTRNVSVSSPPAVLSPHSSPLTFLPDYLTVPQTHGALMRMSHTDGDVQGGAKYRYHNNNEDNMVR